MNTWQQQLRDAEGKDVLLGRDVAIPVIAEGESASVLIGSSFHFLQTHPDTTCRGKVEYANASGRRYIKPFAVTAEHERVALSHDEEMPKTLRELQNIPDELKDVAHEIARLRDVVERIARSPSEDDGA